MSISNNCADFNNFMSISSKCVDIKWYNHASSVNTTESLDSSSYIIKQNLPASVTVFTMVTKVTAL